MEAIKAKLSVSDAIDNRDALAKTVYHRLFLWLQWCLKYHGFTTINILILLLQSIVRFESNSGK